MSQFNLLPGIPPLESPLFPSMLKAGEFAGWEELAMQLHGQGWAVLDLGVSWVAPLASEIRKALAPEFDLERWRAERNQGGLRLQDAWKWVPAVAQLALASPVLEALKVLYGRMPYPFQTLNFPVGTQQHFHSDAVHFQSDPPGFMCGVWIALEDIHPDAGPLEYYPGSHRLPYLQARDVGYQQQEDVTATQEIFHQAWQEMLNAEGLKREIFTPRQGQALIWTANLMHGGSTVRDYNLTRWSQVTHYFFEDCLTYIPMLSNWPLGKIEWRNNIEVSDLETSLEHESAEANANGTALIDQVYRLNDNTIAIFGWCIDPLPTLLEVHAISGLHSINIGKRLIARPDVAVALGKEEEDSFYGFFELLQLPAGDKLRSLRIGGVTCFLELEDIGEIDFDSAVNKLVGSCNYPHTLLPITGQPLANTLDQSVMALLSQDRYQQQWQQLRKTWISVPIGKLNQSTDLTVLLIPSGNKAVARAQLALLAQEQKLQSGEARLLICNSCLQLGDTSLEERFDWLQVQSNIYGLPFELLNSAPPGVDLHEIIFSILCQQNTTYFSYIGPSVLSGSVGWLQHLYDIFCLNKSLLAAAPRLVSSSSLENSQSLLTMSAIDADFNTVESLSTDSFFVRTEKFKRCVAERSIVKSGACLSVAGTASLPDALAIVNSVAMIDLEIIAADPIQLLQDKWMNWIASRIGYISSLKSDLLQTL